MPSPSHRTLNLSRHHYYLWLPSAHHASFRPLHHSSMPPCCLSLSEVLPMQASSSDAAEYLVTTILKALPSEQAVLQTMPCARRDSSVKSHRNYYPYHTCAPPVTSSARLSELGLLTHSVCLDCVYAFGILACLERFHYFRDSSSFYCSWPSYFEHSRLVFGSQHADHGELSAVALGLSGGSAF